MLSPTAMTLQTAFAEVFHIPVDTVVDVLQFDQIPTWDSMAHMLLITRLEDDFGVQFSGDEIADMRSVADARKALTVRGIAA